MIITLAPGRANLAQLEAIYRDEVSFKLTPDAFEAIEKSASRLLDRLEGNETIYGVNTGFGKLASVKIDETHLASLQRNLVRSHCAGFGEPLPLNVVRLVMALKCLSLGRGASGVRIEVVELLQNMVSADIIPVIPAQGSVGASGDLAPLAHMAAAMIGEGDVFYKGEQILSSDALQQEKLRPIVLQAKEGLALLNGTQVSTALCLAGLFDAWRLAITSITTTALSIDAAMGSSAPFHDEIHQLRGHPGQIDSAKRLRQLLHGSEIRDSHKTGDERVQDPYCLRCAPQVIGACMDQLRQALFLLGDKSALLDQILLAWAADTRAMPADPTCRVSPTWQKLIDGLKDIELPVFPLTGAMLLEIGFEPGPNMGRAIKTTQDWWRDANFEPDLPALQAYAAALKG